MALRVSLTERVSIEAGGVVVDEQRFPGRKGRLLFAYLLAAQGRPVPRSELADALWGDEPPATWEKAVSVLVSKLRTLLNECGVDGSEALTNAFGCYQLVLPPGSWVDVPAADEAAAAAEHALAAGDWDGARVDASTAESLARGTFLPGEDSRWVDDRRAELREILVRALECLADANRLAGDPAAAVHAAEELIALVPFRERGHRLLMQAQSAAGNDAEALRTYERCRTLLADELGAYPSPETEAVYLDILRSSPGGSIAEVDQLDADGLSKDPTTAISEPPRRDRRKLAAVVAVVLLLLVLGAAALAFVPARGDARPPEVLPNSVVRIDPDTLERTQVVRVGNEPDVAATAGGFVWVIHRTLRSDDSNKVRDSGDRVLTRIDPSTGDAVVVGGGLAPCAGGLVADPSGDVWVANCYAAGSGAHATVVRVDAKTLRFEATWPVPAGTGFFRGLAYGDGSLWVADASGQVDYHGITEVDPQTGARRRIKLDRHATGLGWSEGYGDLWMNDFARRSVSRMHAQNGAVKTFESVGVRPAPLVVQGDTVWVGDWELPQLYRIPAVGSGIPRLVSLPVKARLTGVGVTAVAAGGGWIWATVPVSRALWRIDPNRNRVTRIPLRYFPWGVAAGDDGVWVTVRATKPD